LVRRFERLGFQVMATRGTAKVLQEAGIKCQVVNKIEEGPPDVIERLSHRELDLVINTPSATRLSERDDLIIRRAAVEHGIPCITSLDTAAALVTALETVATDRQIQVRALKEIQSAELSAQRES
ncbi:MAG: carbamoyl-phosphate synthase large subunit, partial [Armatimonadota bacterium]|nr:carbamoyl-phosphate synthase large subunit [Armatimonadota bacterium]